MFFPLFKTLALQGFVELAYLPPNNWENPLKTNLKLYLLWPSDGLWKTRELGQIQFGQVVRFSTEDFGGEEFQTGLALVYPTSQALPSTLDTLPAEAFWSSRIPEWRCTSGLYNSWAQTSYQSEIFPFPNKASLLTFHPFIQEGDLRNYLVLLNVIKEPRVAESFLEIRDAASLKLRDKIKVFSNSLNCIPLDVYKFSQSELPIFYIDSMAAIPFGLGVSKDGQMLSLEHTHPPASLVLFGQRNSVQGRIKQKWVSQFGVNNGD